METYHPKRTIAENIRRKLGSIIGDSPSPGTERSLAEERMIAKMQKNGGQAFRILRSPETNIKKHERPTP